MAIRPNRYNDPAIGAAFENIAGLFAPLGGQDVAGYAAADLNRQKAMAQAQQIGLTDMFANGQGINDNLGIAAGLYTPNQSWGAVQLGDSTTRRGQDLGYRSSTENNIRDNESTQRGQDVGLRGDVFDTLLSPVGEGEIRPGVTDEIAAWVGLPTGVGQVEGRVKPMTEDQVAGSVLQGAVDQGLYTPQNAADARIYDGTPVEVIGPDGTPIYRDPTTAMRDGLPVYDKPSGSGPKLTNVRLPDGRQTTAIETPQGLVDPATGQRLPEGTTMFSTAAQGSAEDVGLGTTPAGKVQLELIDNTSTQDVGQRLIDLVTQNPSSQGAVGWLRSTAQDMMQTGNEIGQYFGGEVARIADDVTNGVADAALMQPGGAFDTALPSIDLLMNLYVYNYAKSITGERLSNEAIRQWRQSMGLDNAFGNQANTLARLTEAQQSLRDREGRLRETLGSGVIPGANVRPQSPASMQAAPAPAQGADVVAPPAPAPSAPAGGGGRVRYDANGNRIE